MGKSSVDAGLIGEMVAYLFKNFEFHLAIAGSDQESRISISDTDPRIC